MRSGGLVVIVLLVAVGGLAWLLTGGSGSHRVEDDDWALLEDGGADGDTLQGSDGSPRTIQGGGTSDGGTPRTISGSVSALEGVSGRVVDAEGAAIAGARIFLFEGFTGPAVKNKHRLDGEPLASTVSANDGSFRVGPAPAGQPLRIRGTAEGFAPAVLDVAVRGGRVVLVLDRGGTLLLRVVDNAGEPVHKAQAVHIADKVLTRATSDAEGIVEFAALPAGSSTVLVSAAGYRSMRDAQVPITTDETTERTIVLGPAQVLEGKVVDGATEAPMTDVQVSLRYPTMPGVPPEPTVRTDHEGRFRVTNHAGAQERLQVRAVKGGYAEARRVRSGTDASSLVVKMYRRLDSFRGVVFDTERRPARGATVTYGRLGGADADDDLPSVKTDETGAFRLPPPPWGGRGQGYQLMAISSAGEIGQTYVPVPKDENTPPRRAEIFLVGSGKLEGRVLGADGAGVEGAVVQLQPDWSQRRPGGSGLQWQVYEAVNERNLLHLEAITDGQGNYLLLQVPAMTYRVHASFGAEEGDATQLVTVLPGEMAQMDVTLGSGRTIEGWVHDNRNEPVPGAQVRATATGGPRTGRPRILTTRSRSDGRFVLSGAGDATYQVTASMLGFGSALAKNVAGGQTDVELILPQRGRILAMVTENGRPYTGTFSAQAHRAGGASGAVVNGRMWSGGQATRTFNSEDGRFELSGLSAGNYTVRVSTSDGRIGANASPVRVEEGRDTELVRVALTAGATLQGKVTDTDGTPLENAWIHAWPQKNAEDNLRATNVSVRSQKDGGYALKGLGPGAYNVSIWAQGRNWTLETELRAGETRNLDLKYERPGSLEIVVVDTEGAPIERASPMVMSKSGVQVHPNYQAAKRDGLIPNPQDWAALQQTDRRGRVVRHHVPPGRYKISARHNDFLGTSQETWVDVSSGQRAQARVVMRRKNDDNR